MKNAFLLTDDPSDIENGKKCGVTEFAVATHFPDRFTGEGVTAYKIVEKPQDAGYPRIALLTLERESLLNAVIDEVYENKPELIVAASYDLTETGRVQAREGVTPVQLLHREGILDKCAVVGGNYLDRDDVELMQMCGTPLILCITSSMGHGFGMPHVVALKNKLNLSLGSGDNAYNANGDMIEEARALVLGSNCEMRAPSSVSPDFALSLVGCDSPDLYAAIGIKTPKKGTDRIK